jgi:cysteinyl-tRNA synthetase
VQFHCVTVYDECPLGHARAYVSFDVLRRYLAYQNYEVIYVQNFTDIDDKIIAHAKKQLKEGEDMQVAVKALAKRNIDSYFEVMDALGVKRATTYPKATDHITHMIAMIEVLIKKGVAYASGGDVFLTPEKTFEKYL